MKIETIEINGFKKLNKFSLDPAGKSVEISGRNGHGKSSIIDAIWVALTGKDVPGVPVNKDSVSAKIVVGLDDGHTAKLSFNGRGKTLVVEGPDGEPVKAPATFLETLIGKISFDPFEFVELQPAKQKEFLQKLLGLDFSDLDRKKAALLAENREEQNKAKAIESQIEDLADAKDVARVDVGELLLSQEHRTARLTALRDAENESARLATEAERIDREGDRLAGVVEDLRRRLAEAEKAKSDQYGKAVEIGGKRQSVFDLIADLKKEVASLEDPSQKIRDAGEINRSADRWDRRKALVAESRECAKAVEAIAEKIKGVEADRENRLFDAHFPVQGLAFTADGVTFNGLPFDKGNQCMSDILKVGVAIAIAQDPALKVVRIKDGSLLDSKSKSDLLAMLSENGFQAFIETVADTELQALVIEEKEVA